MLFAPSQSSAGRSTSPTWSVYDEGENEADQQAPDEVRPGGVRQLRSYKKIGVIKRGAQGVVYVARDPLMEPEVDGEATPSSVATSASSPGRKVAIKRFFTNFKQYQTRGVAETVLREMSLLQALNGHENIVRMYNPVLGPGKDVCAAIELCDLSLADVVVEQRRRMSPSQIKFVLLSIIKGLDRLHTPQDGEVIVHRDLKLSNVLISLGGGSDGLAAVKLGDFGSAKSLGLERSRPLTPATQRITLCYRSPECLLGDVHYTSAVDVWGLGVIFAEMLESRYLFKGVGELGMLSTVWDLIGTPNAESDWPEMKQLPVCETFSFKDVTPKLEGRFGPKTSSLGLQLLKAMLSANPAKRPTTTELLQHPFFLTEEPAPVTPAEFTQLVSDILTEKEAARVQVQQTRQVAQRQLMLGADGDDDDDDDDDCDFELGS